MHTSIILEVTPAWHRDFLDLFGGTIDRGIITNSTWLLRPEPYGRTIGRIITIRNRIAWHGRRPTAGPFAQQTMELYALSRCRSSEATLNAPLNVGTRQPVNASRADAEGYR